MNCIMPDDFSHPVPFNSPASRAWAVAPLPFFLTSSIERSQEVAEVVRLVRDDGTRLVTLTGPGGVGKTRLVLQIAAELAGDYADGTAFVDLSSVEEAKLVAPTLAQAMGVREFAGAPAEAGLVNALGNRHLLLLLDNFEQVVEAAPLVTTLLTSCPRLTVLATSRARLRISGEREYLVSPLALPNDASRASLDEVAQAGAVRLFVERVRSVRTDFTLTEANVEVVTSICRRLDGLPLAIELAAARVSVLSPNALLARLDRSLPLLTGGSRDRPARQQTLRDAIAWSLDLLTPEERLLFRRLAVFVGGFRLDAAEAVAGGLDETCCDVLDGVAALMEASLLRKLDDPDGEPRYRMLETVREFGIEQLVLAGDEDRARGAHADYFLTLAEAALPHYDGVGLAEWLDRIDADHDNLRAALGWAEERGEADVMARTAGALWRFWVVRGRLGEGSAWLERAHALYSVAGSVMPVESEIGIIMLNMLGGDIARATATADGLLVRCRIGDDPYGAFWARIALGQAASEQYEAGRAVDHFQAALELAPATRTPEGYVAVAHTGLAEVARQSGDLVAEAGHNEAALAMFQASSNPWGEALALGSLGVVAIERGDHRLASGLLRDSLTLRWGLRDGPGVACALVGLARVAVESGRASHAARLLGAVEALQRTMGLTNLAVFIAPGIIEQTTDATRAALGSSAFADALTIGRALPLAEAVAEAVQAANAGMAENGSAGRQGQDRPLGLTQRELEVLRLIVDGYRDHEIADELGISRRTVTTYVTAILNKLGLNSRTAAAAYAVRSGLV